jgi:hypothetical protein
LVEVLHEAAQFGIDLAGWVHGSGPFGMDHVRERKVSVVVKYCPTLHIDGWLSGIRGEALSNPLFGGSPESSKDLVIQFMS